MAIYDRKEASFVMFTECGPPALRSLHRTAPAHAVTPCRYAMLGTLAWKAVTRLLNAILNPIGALRALASAARGAAAPVFRG